jgi:colanic acid biosynthesis protein WcaH
MGFVSVFELRISGFCYPGRWYSPDAPALKACGTPRWTPRRGLIESAAAMKHEPLPGERLAPEDFDTVVRLTPLAAIDLVVRSPDARVLVGRRTHEPAKGRLFVPGGRITKNETLAAAFRRISLAELGAEKQIEEARFLGVYEHFYTTNNHELAGFGTHYVVLAYALTASPQALALPKDQHGEFVWLTEPELLSSPEVHKNTKAYFTANKAGV